MKLRVDERQLVRLLDLPPSTRVRHIYFEQDPPGVIVVVVDPTFEVVPQHAESPIEPLHVQIERRPAALDDPNPAPWERRSLTVNL